MSWESIGSCGNGQLPEDQKWILFCYKIAKEYLLHVCGTPPDGCELGVFWQDHDYGSYPTLGLYREYVTVDSDKYLYACESILPRFNEAVRWSAIKLEWPVEEEIEVEEAYETQGDDGDAFDLSSEDQFALQVASSVAELLMRHPKVTPRQVRILHAAIDALNDMPSSAPDNNCTFGVFYKAGDQDFSEMRYIDFRITKSSFHIIMGGSVYDSQVGGDSFTDGEWFIGADGERCERCNLYNLEDTVMEYLNLGGKITASSEMEEFEGDDE